MYDVNGEGNTIGLVASGIAFITFAPLSFGFMMWWGYGGYAALVPVRLQSLAVQIPIYLCVELVIIHGLFFWATRTTRQGALYGFLSPWVILVLIAIPQFFHSPNEASLVLAVPAITYIVHMFFERTLHNDDA
jgi:hypothetical protein